MTAAEVERDSREGSPKRRKLSATPPQFEELSPPAPETSTSTQISSPKPLVEQASRSSTSEQLSSPQRHLSINKRQSVDCAEVIRKLESLLKEYAAVEEPFRERIGKDRTTWKVPTYDALDFCLRVIKITPDSEKPFIASYFAGETGEELVDVQECRRFVGRIRDILYDGGQQRFTIGTLPDFDEEIIRLSKFSSFVTVQENIEARRIHQRMGKEGVTKEKSFLNTRLFPCFLDESRREDFWLFASQITGVAELSERGKMEYVPNVVLEEYIYLEEPIAFELARFAIAIVVKDGKLSSLNAGKDCFEVIYEPEFVSDKDLLPLLPKSGSSLLPKRDSNPPSPILLRLHHLLYRLLHESGAGRYWMQDPEWSEAGGESPASQTTEEIWEDYQPLPKDPPCTEQEMRNAGPFVMPAFGPRAADAPPIDWSKYDCPEGGEEEAYLDYIVGERLDESDQKYTLKEALERKMSGSRD